jgi:hypothetical protein
MATKLSSTNLHSAVSFPFPLPSPSTFKERLSPLGVDNDSNK